MSKIKGYVLQRYEAVVPEWGRSAKEIQKGRKIIVSLYMKILALR